MPSPDIQWPLFIAACMALAITPGPDMVFVVSRALAQGPRAGLVSSLGLAPGLAVHTLLAAFGVSVLLQTSALAYTALKLAGAAYLIWIGLQMWRQAPSLNIRAAGGATPMRRLFVQGTMSALLNPKLALFFLAFLPQFVPAGSASPALDTMVLGLVFTLFGVGIQATAGVIAGRLSDTLRRSEVALRRLFRGCGALMMLLGLRLLVAPR